MGGPPYEVEGGAPTLPVHSCVNLFFHRSKWSSHIVRLRTSTAIGENLCPRRLASDRLARGNWRRNWPRAFDRATGGSPHPARAQVRKSAIPMAMLRQWAPTERRLWEMNFRKFSTIQEADLDCECRIRDRELVSDSAKHNTVSASEGFGGTQ